ncbi:MAG: FAD-binding protein, partial [Sphingomonadales bacterium]
AGKMLRHFGQVLRYGEGQQVVRGRALVARLAKTLFDLDTPIWLNAPVVRLHIEDRGVTGAILRTERGEVAVTARRGVVLAAGGFPHDPARRAEVFPATVAIAQHRTPACSGNTGDGARMAEAAGGRFNTAVSNAAPWMPCSVIPGKANEAGVWPHLVDRQKPGFVSVLVNGKRFGDESAAYHDLVPAMIAACEREGYAEASAWLIGDARGVKRWGIGAVRPFPVPHGHHLRSGYLLKAPTLRALAGKAGIDAAGLEATVERFNAHARDGVDPEFNRGGRAYDLYQGEAGHEPNPCLGPLDHGPFYAVKIYASEIGTYAGLKTDASARVLDAAGVPVPGLYAVGNDQASVFAGSYPGAGATLGPAMTFGYIAGRHLATA